VSTVAFECCGVAWAGAVEDGGEDVVVGGVVGDAAAGGVRHFVVLARAVEELMRGCRESG
jgi:hypothetical protein